MKSTAAMDIKTVRRTHLRQIAQARGLAPKDLVQLLGKTPAYWSNLLRDEKKSFGEKIAREIEAGLNLADLTLDQPITRGKTAHPVSPGPATMAPQTISWGVMKNMKPQELPRDFRVDLEDDAMAPEARAGWRIELSTALVADARIGDDVLVQLGNGEYHYRRFRQDPRGGWVAAALNTDFASFNSIEDPQMKVVAVMEFVLRPRRAAS